MAMMTPAAARTYWLVLLDNASRLVVEADALIPSPRAQSLVVLAQEEVGKGVWVYKTFWSAWSNGDETPSEVPELRKQGLHHVPKLAEASGFLIPLVEFPGSPNPVEVEFVKAHDPEWLLAHLTGIAQEDNQAKKKGFYVDLEEDGSFTVPHEINRPDLRGQVWMVADMIKWFLTEDALRASVVGGPIPAITEMEARLEGVLARGPDE
ncbi:AbiV family abortive infection protein [Isoptericola sp. S6320L]|uniref:AbiV family abortive infection protein n=1 Tax=Isoptericola sp. S6320L TaxID=2926411 RepID=UPI001FF5DF41|nr:AbiV family abortive infection protein [Isoptericola sp. S6320L]MCK0117009.1 AbiV family abortive infection protein [Isoptericola sp. S6320L]